MGNAYIGFYWTLPVNWAKFRSLPANVDAAAAASKTIRYQREVVRRYVCEHKGKLVDEIAFIDVRPDRATDLVQKELRTKAARYAGKATLLYVRFDEISHWRRNTYLLEAPREFRLEVIPLPPEPILIDKKDFNPILHFKESRELDKSTKTMLKMAASEGLRAALAKVPEGNGRWQVIAEQLNGAEVWTSTGEPWTAENVRKHVRRMDTAIAPATADSTQPDTASKS